MVCQKIILDKGYCVLIFPCVKKVAVGIGGSYGRGALVCRKRTKMDGTWAAPAMYALDQGSLGSQLGSTETTFTDSGNRSNFQTDIKNALN
jgi:SH3 domain-containing YSC84-like protein 1